MDLSEVLRKRRSVRKFKDTEISPDIINDILESASLAPETDTCNYYFGVINDPEIKSEIAKATLWAAWVAKAPVVFVCCADISWDIADQSDDDYGVIGNKLRYDDEIIDYLRAQRNRKACKRLLLASPVYIAAQHMILTAVSHNLRGCLVDFMDIERINNILGLPEHITCQVLVPVGYADEIPKIKDKYNVKERVFYNNWEEEKTECRRLVTVRNQRTLIEVAYKGKGELNMMVINNKSFFSSWSGGKDSCLSLYYALKQGGIPRRLVTMLLENGERSRSHGLALKLLQKQSELLDIPLTTYATSWQDYEANFMKVLKELKANGIGIGVFGDIDIKEHKSWVKKVCGNTNILAYLPLWKKSRKKIIEEFIDCGFKAIIIAVKNHELLGKELLGRELNKELIRLFEKRGVDPAGENGEFHTLVVEGPIFTKDIAYELEEKKLINGYWFQDVTIKN